MNSFPDQFSAARQAQLDNGFDLMRSFSDQALDRTSRVFSLQLDASRAAVEQSSNAIRQLLAVRDPRDLLELGSQSQQHLRTMLDYGRELFSIAAAGMTVPLLRTDRVETPALNAPAAPLPQAAQARAEEVAPEAFERIGADTASAAASVAEAVAEQVADQAAEAQAAPAADFALPAETASEASIISVVTSDIEPSAAPTTIAKATSEALDVPVAPPHPVAASVPVEVAVEIELPKIEPVGATPPRAATTDRRAETRGTKGRRKQS
jgi:hypothetical protein